MNAPTSSLAQFGQPHVSETVANGISPQAEPLMKDCVGCRINLRDRDFKQRRPYIALTECDLTARPWNANLDIRDPLPGIDVDARNGAVALVQCPDRTS